MLPDQIEFVPRRWEITLLICRQTFMPANRQSPRDSPGSESMPAFLRHFRATSVGTASEVALFVPSHTLMPMPTGVPVGEHALTISSHCSLV